MGLMGGTGGGVSVPFLKEAPVGRLMVSMTEVVDRKMGSDISALLMDFFRSVPVEGMMAPAPTFVLKAAATGVEVPETGGVLLAENGGIGEPLGRNAFILGLGAPGEGRGETGSPGECSVMALLAAGDKSGVVALLFV